MVIAALVIDVICSALGLVPETRPSIESITERGIELNYAAVLNIVFTLAGVALLWLTVLRGFTDPVCAMRVDRYQTRHRSQWRGRPVFVCSAGQESFDDDPEA
jgi:YHS domain-containing protein